jgi:hypothetical protein
MPKPAVVRRASRRNVRPRPTDVANVLEGQMAELCRDLAVQTKRMRQLQEQADELRAIIRRWVGQTEAEPAANR